MHKIIITNGTVCDGKVVRPNKKRTPIKASDKAAHFLVNTGKAVFAEEEAGPEPENREADIQTTKRGKK